MAFDHEEEEYHLTRSGWVHGSSKDSNDRRKRRPDDAVETWMRFKEQSLGWTDEHISWSLAWYDSSVSDKDRAELRNSFEKPTSDFPES